MKNVKIGDRFNRWEVIEILPRVKGQHPACVARCSCPNQTTRTLRIANLVAENTRCCGCIATEGERRRFPRISTGDTFGRLIAVERVPRKPGTKEYWRLRCTCGNPDTITVYAWLLKSGRIRKCAECSREKPISDVTPAPKSRMHDVAAYMSARIESLRTILGQLTGRVWSETDAVAPVERLIVEG